MKNQKWLKVAALSAALLVPSLVFAATVPVTTGTKNGQKVYILQAAGARAGDHLVLSSRNTGKAAKAEASSDLVYYKDSGLASSANKYAGLCQFNVGIWVYDQDGQAIGIAAPADVKSLGCEIGENGAFMSAAYNGMLDQDFVDRVTFVAANGTSYRASELRASFAQAPDFAKWRVIIAMVNNSH